MPKGQSEVHLVPLSQWSRQGLKTFQQNRIELVHLLDKLVDQLQQQDEFCFFLLDGQAILIEDYLEIRPNQSAAVDLLAKQGRMLLGPWYVTTDGFLTSPEALVRNLLEGLLVSTERGKRLDIGYIPTPGRMIGQIPQIFRNFQIDAAIACVYPASTPSEYIWESPDGSAILLVTADSVNCDSPLLENPECVKAAANKIRDLRHKRGACKQLLLLVGCNSPCQSATVTDLLASNKHLKGTSIRLSSLEQFLAELKKDVVEPNILSGELLSAGEPCPSSSRMDTKLCNHISQTLLERWAEPFGSWAHILLPNLSEEAYQGSKSFSQLIRYAWRLLLQNQTEEAIQGIVRDRVHREIQIHYDQVSQIAQDLTHAALEQIKTGINTLQIVDKDALGAVIVFNAADRERTGLVDIEYNKQALKIEVAEDDGRVIPHDIIIENDHDTQKESTRLQFVAKNLPAIGYSTFYIRQSASSVAPNKDSFEDGGTTIENEFLSINVDRNEGTLTLFDKRTGRSFSELNRYIDGGDAGDLRAYRAPQRDTIIDIPTNTPLQVLRTSGRTGQALEFLQIYRVPRSLAPDRSRRLPLAAQFVPISITTMIRVIRNIPRVDIEVQVSNNALDHRLRVHFPTGINTDVAFYDGHFEVVQRQVPKFTDPVFDSHGELSSQTHPQRAFVTVLGSDTGLTIANRGIPEVEILRNSAEKIDISLTLLRSTGWLRNDSMANTGSDLETPTAQCLGEHQFSYCLIPHGIDPVPAWHEAWAYQTPLEAAITDFHRGSLPLQDSLVSVDNPYFQISAVKPSLDGQGIIVRGYSISGEEETVNLHTSIPNQGVEIVNLDESPTGYAPVYQGADRYMFVSRPYEIVTLKFTVP